MNNISIFRLTAVLVLVLATTVAAVAEPTTQGCFAPNEIIVKFRPPADVAGSSQDAVASGKSIRQQELQVLRSLHGVQKITPLLKDLDPWQASRRTFWTDNESRLDRGHRRLLRRRTCVPASDPTPDPGGIYRVRLHPDSSQSIEAVLAAYRSRPDVQYAELNPIISICATPSDERYAEQWALTKIQAPEAWDTCRGSFDVVVAVIDTGVDYNHRDLRDNMWVNEAELNGLPGVDDDGNGYVDDVRGYNFAYNNSDPADDHGHGTHCAGTIAAAGNNGLDIAGVCWNARIMPLKILSDIGDGTAADAVPAIYYAVANGADVISGSWGGEENSDALREAVAYAYRRGVIVVAAAGNENSSRPYYPAAYPEVISVAATDSEDRRWYLSNFGNWVDLAAPGRDILSLRAGAALETAPRGEPTSRMSGTSMAAPHVSGACALLLSANPLLTCDELQRILTTTGDIMQAGTSASNRRLSVYAALRAAVPSDGVVRLDRARYAEHAEIGVLVADWHLKGNGRQEVVVMGAEGDEETITLTETQVCLGVFQGAIVCDGGTVNRGDGVLQVSHGELIYARYMDKDNGFGRAIRQQDRATADFEPPAVLNVSITERGPATRVELATSEPAEVEIRYGRTCGGPYDHMQKGTQLSDSHSIELRGLAPQAQHCFVVWIIDEAGNETIADGGGQGYSFLTSGDFEGFRVPSVYPTIQAAIDDAWDGDTIWVADGTYTGEGNIEIDFRGKAVTVRSENGPAQCIIDCQKQGRAFSFSGGETAESILDGFTVTNGGNVDYGGGIRCVGSSPTIRHCILTNNSAGQYGGGLYNSHGSHPTILNCTFRKNSSSSILSGRGGGMANRQGSHPTVSGCTFVENSSRHTGGALGNFDNSSPHVAACAFRNNSTSHSGGAAGNWDDSRPIFRDCVFSDNHAPEDGGAVTNMANGGSIFENCLLYGNVADGSGGAVKNYAAVTTMANCTITGNRAGSSCGGIWNDAGGEIHLSNCILWANREQTDTRHVERAQIKVQSGAARINYCDVQGWAGALGGIGNFGLDPLFVDPGNGDFHLRSEGLRWDNTANLWTRDRVTSPCIDAGNPGWHLGAELLTAPGGASGEQAVNTRIDMGAYGGTPEASLAPVGWSLLADMDNSGTVDWSDLAIMALGWMETADGHEADLTRNGTVNLPDLAHLARQWRQHVNRQGGPQ